VADPVGPNLLILRALGLGDLLTSVPALRGLRRRFPDHRLTLIAPAYLAPLARSSGAIDTVVDRAGLDVASLAAPLPAVLHGAEVAVNLHGRGPQSSRLLATARPHRLVAFAHPDGPDTAGGPAWDADEHEVHRWCRLVVTTGADPRPDDLLLPPPPEPGPPCVVVHPGAASAARRWPVDRWATVVRALVDDGHVVLLTGSAAERPLGESIRTVAGVPESQCHVVAGTTDVAGLASLVASARLVLCGDTGVGHLATAFATPSVLLFGPVSPDQWGPITGGPHRVLWAGRLGDPHGAEPDPGLLQVTTGDVLTAARSMLDAAARRASRRRADQSSTAAGCGAAARFRHEDGDLTA
jgi:ADP-heptose:LPS heptosyltransferase